MGLNKKLLDSSLENWLLNDLFYSILLSFDSNLFVCHHRRQKADIRSLDLFNLFFEVVVWDLLGLFEAVIARHEQIQNYELVSCPVIFIALPDKFYRLYSIDSHIHLHLLLLKDCDKCKGTITIVFSYKNAYSSIFELGYLCG